MDFGNNFKFFIIILFSLKSSTNITLSSSIKNELYTMALFHLIQSIMSTQQTCLHKIIFKLLQIFHSFTVRSVQVITTVEKVLFYPTIK